MKEFWQKFGKSLLLPISTIAVAGIFSGLAAAMQNSAIVGETFANLVYVQDFIGFIRKLAGLVFGNLPLFFCLSIAVGMAKDEKPTAAFSAVLGFLVFHFTLNYILFLNGITADSTSITSLMGQGMSQVDATIENAEYEMVLGYFTLRMNVFGGILVGLIVTWLHNHFYTIKLPSAVNFFGGKRFVPLVTIITIPFAGIASYFVWPFFNSLIGMLGSWIQSIGVFGPFVYGAANRLLIPTGLHHILNQVVRFTPVGGTAVIDGETVMGALNIFNAAIAAKDVPNQVFQMGARYVGQGHSLIVIFGLPAASLAMYRLADPGNKKRIKALLTAGVTASILTGVTEPLEFSFMFISPILFMFHVIMTGLGYMAAALLHCSVGGVQGGLIDFTIFGIFRGTQSKWYLVVLIGIVMALIYYFGFTYLIKRFNISTPGRNEDIDLENGSDSTAAVSDRDAELAGRILTYLGGRENITEIANCFTRLRVTVKDMSLVQDDKLKTTGASGIAHPSSSQVQVIYGLKVESIARDVKALYQSR